MAKKNYAKELGVPAAESALGAAKRKVTKSPQFASIYANDIQVQTSPWDMRFVFGELGDVLPAEFPTVDITALGELRISLQLAKKLTMIMIQQLKTYEERIGEIAIAKD